MERRKVLISSLIVLVAIGLVPLGIALSSSKTSFLAHSESEEPVAPQPISPQDGLVFVESDIELIWEWSPGLAGDQAFAVRLWYEDELPIEVWTQETRFDAKELIDSYSRDLGNFYWQVAVVNFSQERGFEGMSSEWSAVQTLSRLNRNPRGKSETIVLDFVNDAEEIQLSFQPYYQTTFLEEETDPNKLYDLAYELEQFEAYTPQDVDDFAAIFFDPAEAAEKMQPVLDRVVAVWRYKQENDREDFRSVLQSFIRLYGFTSQFITFADADLEKLYVFAKHLNRKLPKRKRQLPYYIRDAVSLDSFRIQQTYTGSISLEQTDSEIPGISTGTPALDEDERDALSNILQVLNHLY